MFSNT